MAVPTADRGVNLSTPRVPLHAPESKNRSNALRNPATSLAPRVVGAGLLIATGAIHLDLYLTGYRTIPTIGALFLLQVITSFALALAILATRGRIASAAGAGFALSTLAGYVVSLRTPLFGFREVRTVAGVIAGVVEVIAFAMHAAITLWPTGATSKGPRALTVPLEQLAAARPARWVASALLVLAAAALAASLSSTPTTPSGPGAGSALLKVTTIGGVAVLTNAAGLTLYWFVPDSPTKSTCDASCASYWPPVIGTPTAGSGVHGALGTIRRSDGTTQATYNGHPLYTYLGDSSPGQASGNNINLNGGLWHEMAATPPG